MESTIISKVNTLQAIDISKISAKDLHRFNISELVYIYLTSGQIPFYSHEKNMDDPIFAKILFNEFTEFIQDTKQRTTIEQFKNECRFWWNLIPDEKQQVEIKKDLPVFSYFLKPITNLIPRSNIDLLQLYEIIKHPKYFEKRTNEFRNIADKEIKADFKKTQFDYVTFSGTFEKRNSSSVINQSGYLCIDIDHLQTDITELKSSIVNDSKLDVQLMFISPSGGGLKVVIPYDYNQINHIEVFDLLEKYFLIEYNIQIDKACKNIDRACYICYDSEVFINSKFLK